MTKIPTISERLAQLGYEDVAQRFEAAQQQISNIREKIQRKVLDHLYEEHGLDPLQYFFSPDEPYFRLTDHQQRGMQKMDYVHLQMNTEAAPDAPNKILNIHTGGMSPTRCNDLQTFVDTMQLLNDLYQALADTKVQELITQAYDEIYAAKDQRDEFKSHAHMLQDKLILEKAANWCGLIALNGMGLQSQEQIQEWLDSMDKDQLLQVAQGMQITRQIQELGHHDTPEEDIKKVIIHYFCVPD